MSRHLLKVGVFGNSLYSNVEAWSIPCRARGVGDAASTRISARSQGRRADWRPLLWAVRVALLAPSRCFF